MKNKQKRILIVDDSVVIRKAIIRLLNDYDVEVIGTANNGYSALDMFREHKPDIVTLDITMPRIDGFQVLNEMVAMNTTCHIIVITALTDKATGLRALKEGAKNYLTKPFKPEKLNDIFKKIPIPAKTGGSLL